jgi:hypothetical protein
VSESTWSNALRQLSEELAWMKQRIAQLERNQRADQLSFASIEAGALTIVDPSGNPMILIGQQEDGSFGHVALAANIQAPVSDPLVAAGVLGIYVTWDGLMADASGPPADFAYVQIHVSTVSGFTPDQTTLAGRLTHAGLYVVGNLLPGVPYYVLLVPIGTDGTAGTQSNQATAAPTAVPDNIPAGAVTGSMIASGAVTGPNIAAGAIAAQHIAAGTVVAGIIDATVVNAVIFNGSVFNGADFVIDSSGERYYSGFPAAGNLSSSLSPSTSAYADAYGNNVLPGVASYGAGTASAQLFGPNLNLTGGAVNWSPSNLSSLVVGSAGMTFTDVTVVGAVPIISLTAPDAGNAAGPGWLEVRGISHDGTVAALLTTGAPLAIVQPGLGAGVHTAETLHAFSFANTWSQAAGRTVSQYFLAAAPATSVTCVLVMGSVVVPTGFVAGQAITNAAAAVYRPTHLQSLFGIDITPAPQVLVRLVWGAGGALTYNGVVGAGTVTVGDIIEIPPQLVFLGN